MNSLTEHDMETHVSILGWLFIIGHALFLAIGAFVFLLLMGVGLFTADSEAMPVLAIVATFVGGLMAVLALPGLLAGYGLLRRRTWGRILALVVAALNIFNVPIGTVLALYAFYVLLQTSANDYFAGQAA